MEPEKYLPDLMHQLVRIADSLERLANSGEPVAPNFERPISEYKTFDWTSINATVIQSDADGPTHVEWNGLIWMRRSPSNKYEPAIWYSRSNGKDDDGEVRYLRLITFKTVKEADPIPGKVAGAVTSRSPSPAPNGHPPVNAGQPSSPKPQAAQPQPVPVPATPPRENLNNGQTRPYPPAVLRDKLRARMQQYASVRTASQAQRNLAASMLTLCFAGNDSAEKIRHSVQDYLFGDKVSISNAPHVFILALLAWLEPKEDSGGDYRPSVMAIREAQAVWKAAQIEAGQAEIPF